MGNFWVMPLLHSVNDMDIHYEQFLHNPHLMGSAVYLKIHYYPRNLINRDFPLPRKTILMIHVDPTDECDQKKKKGVLSQN